MLTPQAIKDQEFQIKFRGYDAIEVKAYLELLADDFFELTEQNRTQLEEIESLVAEQESLQREKQTLESEVKNSQENAEGIQSEIEEGYKHKDEMIEELTKQLESLEETVARLEGENNEYKRSVETLETELSGTQGVDKEKEVEYEKLKAKVNLLEEQNKELKQEGIDFKTTILAAQKFADNLRTSSEEEAQKMIEDAKLEVEKVKNDAFAELAKVPEEIKELNQKKYKVRDELKEVLNSYLAALDSFPENETSEVVDDLSDLFQSIQIPDGESVDPDDIDNINLDEIK